MQSELEPGILPVFRLFVLLQLAQAIWSLLRSERTNYIVLGENFPRLSDWLVERQISGRFYLAWAVVFLLFLLFLSLPQFQRWLKRYYLPLALTLQIVILVFYNDWIIFARMAEHPDINVEARNWQMFVYLSVPILLASWQYSFRFVLLFIFFSGGLDFFILRVLGSTALFRSLLVPIGLFLRTILYGLIGYIVSRLMKEQRKLRLSLQDANRKLTHYVSTLDALATARERNRLARELHDTLAHTLSGLVIQLESINILWDQDAQRARRELQASTLQAREGLNGARRAIKSLRAEPLVELGLPLALRQIAEDAAGRGNFALELHLPDTLPFLPPETENDLYRVSLEAFENIVRHARAAHVRFSLERVEQSLRLEITDDGIGFEPGAVETDSHFGLLGLRERADLRGAEFKVISQPGQGTKICLQLEVPQ